MQRREGLQPPGSPGKENREARRGEEWADGAEDTGQRGSGQRCSVRSPGKQGAGWAGGRLPPNGPHRGPVVTQVWPFPWLLCSPRGLGFTRCFLGKIRKQRSLSPREGECKAHVTPSMPMVLWGMQSSPVPHLLPRMLVMWAWDRGKHSAHLRKGSGPASWPLGHSWASDFPEGTGEEEWRDVGARGQRQEQQGHGIPLASSS